MALHLGLLIGQFVVLHFKTGMKTKQISYWTNMCFHCLHPQK